MASANRLRVERIIRQLNTRDPDIADLCHPEIEWRWPATTPGALLFRGHAELQRGLFTWAELWDELEMEPEEILEDGDYVLVIRLPNARRGKRRPPGGAGGPPAPVRGRAAQALVDVRGPGEHFFGKPPERPRTHHLHVCEVGSEHEFRHVAVRDFLRTHADEAARYAALKHALRTRSESA